MISTTAILLMTDTKSPLSLPSTMLFETLSRSIFPNGIPNARPIAEPMIAMPKYLIRYSPLTERFFKPIAFITPISRNSSRIVKPIVNLSTTNDTIISATLIIRRIPAIIIFIT